MDGYFVHFFAPDGMKPIPKDILFVLDVSGSMWGTKIKQQRDAMDKILQDLNDEDRFNIMKFSSEAKYWKSVLVKVNTENVQEARKFAEKMQATGGNIILKSVRPNYFWIWYHYVSESVL